MRERFGSWGLGLPDADFAIALLVLGLIPPELRTQASVHQQQGLLERLQQDKSIAMEWWLDVLPTEKTGWASLHSVTDLIRLFDHDAFNDRSIAMRTDGVVDALSFWSFLRLSLNYFAPPFPKLNIYILMPSPSNRTRFRWPVRVGYFSGTFSEEIASDLDTMDYWNGNVFSTLSLDRRHCECDVMIWKSIDLGTAIEELSSVSARSGGVVTDLLFLCLETDISSIERCDDLLPLYRAVEASGIVLFPTLVINEAQVLQNALVEMSHDISMEKAFNMVTDHQALLIADESLLQESRLGDRIHAIARAMQRPEQASRPIDLDDDSVGFLRLPKLKRMSRAETGVRIEAAMPDYDFTGEQHEASAIGRIVRIMEDEDKSEVVARYLQAGLSQPGEHTPFSNKPLKHDKDYDVLVFVGEQNPAYQSVDQPFPQLEPLNYGQSHRLTVVFWEPAVSPEPQIAHIELPSVGNSGLCVFHIRTLLAMKKLNARITVLHRGRVLQTAMLLAPVGKVRRKHTFKLDAVPRRILNGLEERQKFDTAIILNDTDGQSQIHVTNHDRATVLDMDHADIKELIKIMGSAIGEITYSPDDYASLRSKGSEELLRRLAQKGASIRRYLLPPVLSSHMSQSPTHVQLVMAKADKILPIEFVYEFEAPEPDSLICPKAERCLEHAINGLLINGKCPDGCPPVDATGEEISEDMLICPLAFWGIRCVIERRVHDSQKGPAKGDVLLHEPVKPKDQVLKPVSRVMIAATDRANPPSDPEATQRLIERIKAVAQDSRVVHGWKEWVTTVKNYSPALLTMVAHQADDGHGTAALEIGVPPNLISDLVKPKHIPQNTHSIALIIGCETGVANIDYENFASRFHKNGAAVVVSTIAKILGRHAAPLAAEIIEEMSLLDSQRPFGEIIRIVKCRLLLQGTPMVLALTAIGDADWDVAGNG